ncbi:MAG: choice-of-anchor tandem repeat GloVer-containing protein [Rhizomicrobium sp.]
MTEVFRRLRFLLVCAATLAFLPIVPVQAATFNVIHAFTGGGDGGYPAYGTLIRDAQGNFYGSMGIPTVFGAVYEMSPHGSVTILYTFNGHGGAGPDGLILDKKGNLWGPACCGGGKSDCGVVFKLTSNGDETPVHRFTGAPRDGCLPYAALIIGKNRDLYGATGDGGKDNYGTVFEISARGHEKVIHSFTGGKEGYYPFAALTMDAQGNLYGVTVHGGGRASAGVVFEMSATGAETPLYDFKGSPNDGSLPDGTLILDASGNIYGTTLGGGRAGCYAGLGCGVVFELAPDGTETVLHKFEAGKDDGANPVSGLIADSAGNLYGTTEYGGGRSPCNGANGCGTVFEIAADGTETVLHKFDQRTDGANLAAGLVADGSGDYYGTTSQGGRYGYGTVFEISP